MGNGMDDETMIPDDAIELEPSGASPSDIRPGNQWVTNGPDDRTIKITVGETLKSGGTIKLVENDNVEEYTVSTLTPAGLTFVKTSPADGIVVIPAKETQTGIKI